MGIRLAFAVLIEYSVRASKLLLMRSSAARKRIAGGAVALACLALLLDIPGTRAATVSSTASTNDFTLVVRERVGPYRYWRTLKEGDAYARAVAAFGKHTSVGKDAPRSNLCTVRWETIGLDIAFAGAVSHCSAASLRRAAWYGMRLWGPRWRTTRNLRIGDRVARIRALYPRARYVSDPPRAGEWWLITQDQKELGKKPLLVAEVGAGRVITIRVPAGYIF